jgi:hypothetical protein
MKNRFNIFIVSIIMGAIFLLINIFIMNKFWGISDDTDIKENIEHIEIKDTVCFKDQVLSYIFELRLEHPYVVYAQALEETGRFNSTIFRENNNLFGMKMAWNRATTAIGINRGHAVYKNWKHSVIDYALFQSSYMRGLTRDEYINKLSRMYAENELYKNNLLKIIERL